MLRLAIRKYRLKGIIPLVLLVSILTGTMGCNLNQNAGEQMVNLQKVSDDPDAQLKHLNAAIVRNKMEASLYTRRATLLLQKGEHEKALVDVNEAIKLDDNNIKNLFLKAQVLRALGKYKEALAFALQAERNSYQSASLYILLSDLYLQANQPQKAATYVKRALELAPDNAYALYYKGHVAAATGDTALAVANYRLALQDKPDFTYARRDLAGALISLKKYEEAALEITKTMKKAPEDAILWYHQGQLLQATQRSDSALWSYNKALTLNDTLQGAHYQAGMLLYARGDNAGAITHFEKVAKAYANNIKYITTLASAYERTGQNIKALEQYQRLDTLQPGYTFADQSIARLKAKLTRPVPAVSYETDTASINE